ncbi:hypothetical protein DJ017_06155 [Phenylobacterium soli]|uniref:Uncharacterized protein n=1 Tax=Phenylobacterium soli TaxID=2170551 RepID=A0A328AGX6_9CAUL|nr:hypothetical protein DJ017_06155 [Phenylobacterium soli]
MAELARRSRTAVEPAAFRILKTEIIQCVADAAAGNAKVWSDLVTRIQTDCVRFDAAADPDGQVGCDGRPAGPRAERS